MGRYTVQTTPVNEMSPDAILAEADEIRFHLAEVEADLSVLNGWAATERSVSDDKRTQIARARSFRAHLIRRYTLVRQRERAIIRTRRDLRS